MHPDNTGDRPLLLLRKADRKGGNSRNSVTIPTDELYELACQVKELLDYYELQHVMPPSPDLDYNELRTSGDGLREQLRQTVQAILVRSMGEGILQSQHRNKTRKTNANRPPN